MLLLVMVNMHKKILIAIGIVILFLGVTIQPAIATVESKTSDDDCNLCSKKVSKSHLERLTTLFERLEKCDNQLSEQSKLYPELEEKYQDLSNRFTTLTLLNEIIKLNSNWFLGYIVICSFLLVAIIILLIPEIILENLVEKYPALYELYEDISNITYELDNLFFGVYQCKSWPPWEQAGSRGWRLEAGGWRSEPPRTQRARRFDEGDIEPRRHEEHEVGGGCWLPVGGGEEGT